MDLIFTFLRFVIVPERKKFCFSVAFRNGKPYLVSAPMCKTVRKKYTDFHIYENMSDDKNSCTTIYYYQISV